MVSKLKPVENLGEDKDEFYDHIIVFFTKNEYFFLMFLYTLFFFFTYFLSTN